MNIQTRHFGEIEIDTKDIITFSDGLPGFEDLNKFVTLGQDAESPFGWLQSVDHPEYAFVFIDPFQVVDNYYVDLDDDIVNSLGAESSEDIVVYTIVVVPEDITKMTANLQAPIIINVKGKKGKQVILDNSKYSMRHYLLGQQVQGGMEHAGTR